MLKRVIDLIVCVPFLVLFMPPLILLALIFNGRPVFYTQSRPGLNGAIFKLYKLRSMTNQFDEFGDLLPDKLRLTAWGRFIRSSSLDEIPSLWNVIKGDMSLVGPRPLLVEYLSLYSDNQKKRHDVRPGVTGWAQVNGRNSISWEDKFNLDVWYVENQSFWLDMRILWMTIKKVIMREGISAEGEATMPKFTGNKK